MLLVGVIVYIPLVPELSITILHWALIILSSVIAHELYLYIYLNIDICIWKLQIR